LYRANMATLGRDVAPSTPANRVVGSTDMGNVSRWVPSIHPMLKVSPPDVTIHTPDFAVHAVSAAGDRAVVDGAKAMVMTLGDLWLRPERMASVREAHAQAAREASGDQVRDPAGAGP